MQEAIQTRACCVEGVLKCYPHETLEIIIDRIAEAEVSHALGCLFSLQATSAESKVPRKLKTVFQCQYN